MLLKRPRKFTRNRLVRIKNFKCVRVQVVPQGGSGYFRLLIACRGMTEQFFPFKGTFKHWAQAAHTKLVRLTHCLTDGAFCADIVYNEIAAWLVTRRRRRRPLALCHVTVRAAAPLRDCGASKLWAAALSAQQPAASFIFIHHLADRRPGARPKKMCLVISLVTVVKHIYIR